MIFGTLDMIHRGHINFFEQARGLAKHPFLIVSVARDVNVKKIKGFKPRHAELSRAKKLKAHPLVDKAVLSNIRNYIGHIKKEKPDIIALGYDQTNYTETLRNDLKMAGLKTKIIRLKSHKPHLYNSINCEGEFTVADQENISDSKEIDSGEGNQTATILIFRPRSLEDYELYGFQALCPVLGRNKPLKKSGTP
jgi:FAD synthetase